MLLLDLWTAKHYTCIIIILCGVARTWVKFAVKCDRVIKTSFRAQRLPISINPCTVESLVKIKTRPETPSPIFFYKHSFSFSHCLGTFTIRTCQFFFYFVYCYLVKILVKRYFSLSRFHPSNKCLDRRKRPRYRFSFKLFVTFIWFFKKFLSTPLLLNVFQQIFWKL